MSSSARSAVSPKLLLIELNEFNPQLIRDASAEMPLPNLLKVLEMRHSETITQDQQEHQGLDPWVQWVGVHSGKPSGKHKVRRLGRTRCQTADPIWTIAGAAGLTWGVWGAMNAPRGSKRGCQFFMPDPWSYEEEASSRELNDLLALPRYAARNYLEIDHWKVLKAAARLGRFFLPPRRWPLAGRAAWKLMQGVLTAGANVHTFATLFDYLSVCEFVRFRGARQPDFSLIFLNHIAHLQHQFWTRGPALDPNLAFGLRMADEMMDLLLTSRALGEAILVANGMRQKNVMGQGCFVYRQKQPQFAVETLGVRGGRVEQCMTNEAHIIFASKAEADEAEEILRSCHLSGGHAAFYVEREADRKVFYQLSIEHRVAEGARVVSTAGEILFHDLFELVCERTGAHEQGGDLYSDLAEAPSKLFNHQIFDVVMSHFQLARTEPHERAAA